MAMKRMSDYRLICDLQDNVLRVLVVEIGHRGAVNRGLTKP